LWGINLLANTVFFFPIMKNFRLILAKHQSQAAAARTRGALHRLSDNKGLFTCMWYVMFGWAAQEALAIVKLVNPAFHLGFDWLPTILWMITRLTFYFGSDFFPAYLMASLLRSQRNLDHVIRNNFWIMAFHMVLMVIGAATTLPATIAQTIGQYDEFAPTVSLISIGIYLNLQAVGFAGLTLQYRFVERTLNRVLGESFQLTRDERTKKIRDRLVAMHSYQAKIATGQSFVHLVFGVVPMLWRYHDYWLAISYTLLPIASNRMLASIVSDDDKKTTDVSSNTSPSGPAARKKIPEPNDSSVVDSSDRAPVIHGLDLDPLQNQMSVFNPSDNTIGSESAGVNSELEQLQPKDGRVEVKKSPAMKIFQALTPSRSAKGSKGKFDFPEEELKN
jgi:hypothetical protein